MSLSRRDRRDHGLRGPQILPAKTPGGLRARPRPTRRERFDSLVLGIVTEIETRWERHLGLLEYAVEDTPLVPDDWASDNVPLSSLIRGTGGQASRLVLFRRPIEQRCGSREELEAMVLMIVVEQIAELLGLDAEQVDPRYRAEE